MWQLQQQSESILVAAQLICKLSTHTQGCARSYVCPSSMHNSQVVSMALSIDFC